MSKEYDIILLTREPSVEEAILQALAGQENLSPVAVCRTSAQLLARLEHYPLAIILADLDPDATQILDDLEPLVANFDQTRFIGLAKELDTSMIMRAMQIGVRHVQVKSLLDKEIKNVITRFSMNGSARRAAGTLVSVLSAGGGCGSTTLAINLAESIANRSDLSVLLVDADINYGSMATYLELESPYSLADVLKQRDRIDRDLVASTAIPYRARLEALLSPASIELGCGDGIRLENMDLALAACKQAYQYIIIDAPRLPAVTITSLAEASSIILIVLQLNVKDLKIARGMLELLQSRGIAPEQIVPVINRWHKRRSMIDLDSARKALNGLEPVLIQNDFTVATQSVNYGKTLTQIAPRSGLVKDVCRLAQSLGNGYLHANGKKK